MKPIVFLDLETTGLDLSIDRIVSIATKKLNHDFTGDQPVRKALINPGGHIPAEATAIHGITDEHVKNAPYFVAIAKALFQFLDGCDICGYNALGFDVPLLSEEFERANIVWPQEGTRFFDPYKIFANKVPRTLEGAVKYYLQRDHVGAHDAEADILATIDVLQKQLFEYEDLSIMSADELHKFCVGENSLDLSGHIARNDQGEPIFNFGKHKGKKLKDNIHYIKKFMLGDKASFPADTTRLLKRLLHENKW